MTVCGMTQVAYVPGGAQTAVVAQLTRLMETLGKTVFDCPTDLNTPGAGVLLLQLLLLSLLLLLLLLLLLQQLLFSLLRLLLLLLLLLLPLLLLLLMLLLLLRGVVPSATPAHPTALKLTAPCFASRTAQGTSGSGCKPSR